MKRRLPLSVALVVLGLFLAAGNARAAEGWGFVCYAYGQAGQEMTHNGVTECWDTVNLGPIQDPNETCDWQPDPGTESKVAGCDY